MIKTKNYEMDMTEGRIFPKLVSFTVPLILSGILQLLFNAADVVVVGRFAGKQSLAAVGSTTALIGLFVNLFVGLSVGANVVAAKNYGAGDYDKVSKTVHTSMVLALVSGFCLVFIGFFSASPMLSLMGTKEDVIDLATLYMKIYFLQMPASLVYNFGAALLRAIGDTKRPLYYLTISGIVNVCLNIFFVVVCKMDVAGVALATVISQYLSAFAVVRCLMKTKGPINLRLKDIKVDWNILKEVLRFGLAVGFQSVVFNIGNILIQSSINDFDTAVVAGSTASSSIEGFVYVTMNAVSQGTLCFFSQCIGAKKTKRLPKILWRSIVLIFAFWAIVTGVVLIFSETLLSFYNTDPQVIAFGKERMFVIASTYFLCGVMDTMAASVRGMGYSLLPMIVSLFGACGLRILWIFTVYATRRTTTSIYMSYPISWFVTTIIHIICFIIIYHFKINKDTYLNGSNSGVSNMAKRIE